MLLVKNCVEYHFIFEVKYKTKNNSILLCLMNERKMIRSKYVKMRFTTVIDKCVHALVLANILTDLSLIVNRNMKC